MAKRKIVITHDLQDEQLQRIKEIAIDWDIISSRDENIWLNHIKDAEIIVGWKKEIAEHAIQPNSKLRWFQSWSAGINKLPLESFKELNIILTGASGVHAYPVSETIFALMLALTRKIDTYVKNQREKKWHHSGLSLEMHEKTVGIIGVGAIGKETAKIAKAFGMRVLGVRHSGKREEYVDEMFKLGELNSIIPLCDYIVITLPLTEETYHLFGAKQFQLMKKSAFFINIGRGNIVVEQELIKALQQKTITGAGLDVFEKEPLSEDNPLWDLENVIITPHSSGSTEHYAKRVIEDIFIPNLQSYLARETLPINLIDYEKGY
ncbi:D-2-hydroxyacid dehydrogenase [Metabacillus fastidiosus]|uniref:D-2-hydroxyacid dehydrogenase n=1 Tax=Metabacillus fastidiosus TaxID=1458 RepID=UPI002DB96445|nr:D-2-hydroxyacid dehydrogenase [Metabacillus fastidiosus]MEC2075205.1 D-2-hydroxyacid dehydrogenase [Metabacillus fastidiosus]